MAANPFTPSNALYLFRARDATLAAAWEYTQGDAQLLACDNQGSFAAAQEADVDGLLGTTLTTVPNVAFLSSAAASGDSIMFPPRAGDTYDSVRGVSVLSTNAATNTVAERRSAQYIPQTPGDVNWCFFGATLRPAGSVTGGVTKRMGLWDNSDGFYWGEINGVVGVAVLSSASGVITAVNHVQSTWNIDKLDGTGISGITFDPAAYQTFVIAYHWMGVGSVLFGIVEAGYFRPVHLVSTANTSALPLTQRGNLPVTYRITPTSGAIGNAQLEAHSVYIVAESNPSPFPYGGLQMWIRPSTTQNTLGQSALLSIRYIPGGLIRPGVRILLTSASIRCTDPTIFFEWRLILGGTLTPGFLAGITFSAVIQRCARNPLPIVTGGVTLASGMVAAGEVANIFFSPTLAPLMGLDVAENGQILSLVAVCPQGGARGFNVVLTWREI